MSKFYAEDYSVKVYISSPYTLGDTAKNVKVQLDVSDGLISLGFDPESPLLLHFLQIYTNHSPDTMLKIGLAKVRKSDVVLRLPGKSKGADKEVALAKKLKIPIVRSVEELRELYNVERIE